MTTCPQCGSHRIRRRHQASEGVVHALTRPRLYRCSKCGWKGAERPNRLSRLASGGREKPKEVLMAVLIALVLLGVLWGGAKACTVMQPLRDEYAQPQG